MAGEGRLLLAIRGQKVVSYLEQEKHEIGNDRYSSGFCMS